jgi:hypothetical protein
VELVRKLEMTCGVAEVGVHHYPRLHGRSQFFRVRSLAVTLTQLVWLWLRVVLAPALRIAVANPARDSATDAHR